MKTNLKLGKSFNWILLPAMVLYTAIPNYAEGGVTGEQNGNACKPQTAVIMKNFSEQVTITGSSVNVFSTRSFFPHTDFHFSINRNPYAYSKYYLDNETGFYYIKARYYLPESGRFTSRDTFKLANRFMYCGGNPVNNIDMEGHFPLCLTCLSFAFSFIGLSAISGYTYLSRNPVKNVAFEGVLMVAGLGFSMAGLTAYGQDDSHEIKTTEYLTITSISCLTAASAVMGSRYWYNRRQELKALYDSVIIQLDTIDRDNLKAIIRFYKESTHKIIPRGGQLETAVTRLSDIFNNVPIDDRISVIDRYLIEYNLPKHQYSNLRIELSTRLLAEEL